MIAALLAALATASSATTSARALSAEPLPFVLLTPGDAPKVLRADRVLAEVERVFVPRTSFVPRAEEDPALADCRGRVECIAASIPGKSRYLLVLTVLPARDAAKDFASIVFLERETKHALPEVHVEIEEARELGEHVEKLVRGTIEDEPWGAIAIENLPAEAVVELDGVILGAFDHLEHVRPGEHQIKAGTFEARARVEKGRTTILKIERREKTIALGVWIGGGTAIAGSTLALIGAFTPSVTANCFTPESCGGARLARTGAGASTIFGGPNGGGLSPLQLGLSLAGAGLTSGLLSMLLEEKEWIAYVAGVLAGVAIYATISAADGAAPAPRATN